MNWRKGIPALLGALLPLPLLLVLGTAMRWTHGPGASPGEAGVSPVLSKEERQALTTYQRSCRKREECEPPLGCLVVDGSQALCADSRCQTDLQCAEGETCQLLPTLGGGPRVRQCVLVGVLKEGEPCRATALARERACERGLQCQNGYCGRPCRLEDAASCPEGLFCMKGPAGPSCAPTCEGRTCPEGLQCFRFDDGVSVCAKVRGEDCRHTPCPEGQTCTPYFTPGQKERVTLKCTTHCDEENPSCPTGTACYYRECRQPCPPDDSAACGAGQECLFYPDGQRWFCARKD